MKTIISFMACSIICLSSCAQDISAHRVPSVVLNAFQQKFPKASDLEWERKGKNYEAEFEMNFRDHKVLLDSTGVVVLHKEEVSVNALPEAVKQAIRRDFPDYTIDDADRITSGAQVLLKVELEKGEEDRTVYFSESGKQVEPKVNYE